MNLTFGKEWSIINAPRKSHRDGAITRGLDEYVYIILNASELFGFLEHSSQSPMLVLSLRLADGHIATHLQLYILLRARRKQSLSPLSHPRMSNPFNFLI